ncbi:MAG: hypothetical protein LBO81_01520, partial [Clostridiales Family XIII bacterium]|nr:hypothetical protein [Clostridiales Family XIII bacterium]
MHGEGSILRAMRIRKMVNLKETNRKKRFCKAMAFILAAGMILASMPLGIFAADTTFEKGYGTINLTRTDGRKLGANTTNQFRSRVEVRIYLRSDASDAYTDTGERSTLEFYLDYHGISNGVSGTFEPTGNLYTYDGYRYDETGDMPAKFGDPEYLALPFPVSTDNGRTYEIGSKVLRIYLTAISAAEGTLTLDYRDGKASVPYGEKPEPAIDCDPGEIPAEDISYTYSATQTGTYVPWESFVEPDAGGTIYVKGSFDGIAGGLRYAAESDALPYAVTQAVGAVSVSVADVYLSLAEWPDPKVETNSDGEQTIYYSAQQSGDDWMPADAFTAKVKTFEPGSYRVRIDVAETVNYTAATAVSAFRVFENYDVTPGTVESANISWTR